MADLPTISSEVLVYWLNSPLVEVADFTMRARRLNSSYMDVLVRVPAFG